MAACANLCELILLVSTIRKPKVNHMSLTFLRQHRADSLDLLDEKAAAKRLGVSPFTLARLRKAGEIAFAEIGGRILYPSSAIPAFINAKTVQPCQSMNDLKSKVSGSPAIPTAPSGKQLGMTETPGKLSAHHLAQKIFKKPKSA